MSVWTPQNLGSSISGIVTADDAQDEAIVSLQRGTSEPTLRPIGTLWNRTDYPTLGDVIVRRNAADAWALFADARYAQVNAGGTVAFAADQSMGGYKLTGLAAATAAGQAVRYEQALILNGGGTAWAAGSKVIEALADPSSPQHAATKKYVDDQKPAVGIAVPTEPTGTQRQVVVSGLGFAPRVIQIQLDPYGTAGAERTSMYMAAGYAVNSAPTIDLFVSFADSTSGNPIVTKRVQGDIRRDSTGFTFTWTVPTKTDGSKAAAGRVMWTALP